jgi:hypothetical protein
MDFSPDKLSSGSYTFGSVFSGLRQNSPKYDELASTAAQARSQEKVAAMNAEAQVAGAGISAAATVHAAEEQAKAMKAAGQAQKSAGMMSGLGSIAGAALGLLSDEDTKHTIDYIADATDTLRELRPVTFFYKEEYSSQPERMHYGFIAQEFQKVMPDATYYDETIGKLCIDTYELIALLVRANQQLENRVLRLEAKEALLAV